MKRAALPIAALALLAELIVSRGLPQPSPFVQLPLHGAVVLLGAIMARRSSSPARVAPIALVLCGISLSLLDLRREVDVRAHAQDGAAGRAQVERDAEVVRSGFHALFARERALVRGLPGALLEESSRRD